MKAFALAGILVLVLGAVAQQDGNSTAPTTTLAPQTTATTTPVPTNSTPTTSAPPPPETTTASTTTAKPPTTTTVAPVPKSTTAKPTPKYPANKGKYVLSSDGNGTACIMLEAAIEVAIQYVDANNKTQTATVDVPANNVTDISGDCKQGIMRLAWENNTLTFKFEKNDSKNTTGGISEGKFALQNVTGTVYYAQGNETLEQEVKILEKAAFQTPLNRSYLCGAQETLKNDNGTTTIKFNSLRLEAFMSPPSGHSEFSPYYECAADDASDVVPIVVGSVLAGLIVVVLVAYLIGRRRSRSRGYQSV